MSTPQHNHADLFVRQHRLADAAERYLIAGCLAWDVALDDALEVVGVDDFGTSAHRAVFAALADLRRAGSPTDAGAVFQAMTASGAAALEFGDGAAVWLAETVNLEPTGANVRFYAAEVRNTSLLRALAHVANEILRDADGSMPGADLLGLVEQRVFDLGERATSAGPTARPVKELMAEALQRLDDRQARGGALDGISTGYGGLDRYLAGLRPGQLVVIGARPSVGKTALGLCLGMSAAATGFPMLLFSLEMSAAEIADRLLATHAGVPMHRLKGGRLPDADIAAIVQTANGVSDARVYVDDQPCRTTAQVGAITRRAVRRHGVKLVVVDYLQLLDAENQKENRTQQVGRITRGLVQVARKCNVAVVALCQLNRAVEDRPDQKPRLSDLRESGEIEAHANTVLLLHRPPGQPDDSITWDIDVIVAKNRNGPTGETTLSYNRPLMRFENAAVGGRAA